MGSSLHQGHALALGYFKTQLNTALIQDQQFSGWLTARTPMRRWGEMRELDVGIIFLASNRGAFVTGQTLVVDGWITSTL